MKYSFSIVLLIAIFFTISPVNGQSPIQNQTLEGYLRADSVLIYTIGEVEAGDTIYAYLRHRSGNLDPLLSIHSEDSPWLAVDDDSGEGVDAALEFTFEEEGDYWLQVENCCGNSFGDFELLVSINDDRVLRGNSIPDDSDLISLDMERSNVIVTAIEERNGAISNPEVGVWLDLPNLVVGETLYAHIEQAEDSDLTPCLTFTTNFDKPLAIGGDGEASAQLEFEIREDGDYRLFIDNCLSETTGDYHLVASLNESSVLDDQNVEPTQETVFKAPIVIDVALEMEQITGVDQKSENFGVVTVLRARWQDAEFAFNPSRCNCTEQVLTDDQLVGFFERNPELEWPEFGFLNQQGERISHIKTLAIRFTGELFYLERFTADFQAPAFFFEDFPFDRQHFWMRLESVGNTEDKFRFEVWDNPEFNRYGDMLGEEEWIIEEFETSIQRDDNRSVYSFDIWVVRHLDFYIYRIMIPLLLIIVISWITFLIEDYDTRIATATSNLLIFIAFNFTIGDDLPRLGYLTFLDTFLIISFIITSLVVLLTVWFKRLDAVNRAKARLAKEINKQLIWMYPAFYIISTIILAFQFNVID